MEKEKDMKFEEVLPLMREGKKAYIPSHYMEQEYLICGKQGNTELGIPIINTIIKVNSKNEFINDSYSWGIPCWAIMSDQWTIKDE